MKHQKFVDEEELKELFWNRYKQREIPWKHLFNASINKESIDLLTLETMIDGQSKIYSFVFSIKDIRSVLSKAEANLKYANKSWIVIPIEKEKAVNNRYLIQLEEMKHIGVIGVKKPNGFYKRFYSPKDQESPESLSLAFDLFDKELDFRED